MAIIKLSRRKRTAPREEVVDKISEFVKSQKISFMFSKEKMTLSWMDGPSLEELYDAALAGSNWEIKAIADLESATVEEGVIYANRSLSIIARAIAVVRFAGAKSRPLKVTDPKDQEFFTELLRESVYDGKWQMAELMAKYLVELTQEPKTDELLAQKFIEVGYEKLWNRAFSEMG